MGKTVFVCPVPTLEALKAALRKVVEHNVSEPRYLGGSYTMEEFRALDPMRAKFAEEVLLSHPAFEPVEIGCMQKWNRGDYVARGLLGHHEGGMWLEVQNEGGGANTTMWFRENAPDQGWHGTDGHPQGFFDSPPVCYWKEFATGGMRELIAEYDRL